MADANVVEISELAPKAHDAGRRSMVDLGQSKEEKLMKKSWKKPTTCVVCVGMEMSRYRSAELKAKK
ncbi:hypothetical protein C9413_20515 [Rhizobium sp. SEMIA 4085]|uniref:Uncharacterized protein n=1 Tax=Rhizobium gallicum bv. gallicum R602sp TaxID=1041138 RepID=A0A0B4XFZ8_9HYPH|nr:MULTISPECIES: hypothetical protein [Rhizobium]AJD45568.1 hypothetical protein RGR602_PC01542 [Rhizobium gallicum bv. gallicum R602sp]NNH31777.1 hypothetical protein [Rhizobium sp. SEMIA 4085]